MLGHGDASTTAVLATTHRDRGVDLLPHLQERLFAERCTIRQLGLQPHQANVPPVTGTTTKYLAMDRDHRPCSVVICSAPEEADVVSRAVVRSQAACRALGPLGKAVLTPTSWGEIEGLSYAVYPFCRSMGGSRYAWALQRAWLRPRILRWLRRATRATCSDPTGEEIERNFLGPLSHLLSLHSLPEPVRESARVTSDRLRAGTWSPRHCLMHGDFWKGNLMFAPGTRSWNDFVLIDWPGALVQGYGIYDLISVAPSLKLRGRRLRTEVESHCRILGCEFADARSHLTAALAYIEGHRGHFPWDRFVALATKSLQLLDTIGG